MKGRGLAILVVLAMGLAACGSPELLGGNDTVPESESVTSDAQPTEVSVTEGTADTGAQSTQTTAAESPLVTNPPKETPSVTTTSSALGGGTVDPGLLPLVDQARTDLAGRLGVGAESIALISAELVEWPDASLGCPQPGMVYQQIPSDGSVIVLSSGGTQYRYHTGGSEYVPFLCE